MKLEAGKRYVRRDGIIVGPLAPVEDGTVYPFNCTLTGDNWTEDGSYYSDGSVDSFDLVAEYVEQGFKPEERFIVTPRFGLMTREEAEAKIHSARYNAFDYVIAEVVLAPSKRFEPYAG